MPHNFDLSAYITKNPDDNKLVIQIKITDMAHNHSSNWGNGNSQKTELTWEEQNFMEEQEEGQQAKPDFSEYEWMMEQDEFDSQAKQRIEQDDDIDDMFYWDPSKGCTAGKSAAKNQQNIQNQQNSHQFQGNQDNSSQFQQNPSDFQQNTSQLNTQSSPFTSNFQNSAALKQGNFNNTGFQKAPAQIHNNFQSNFQNHNPFQAQVQNQNHHFQVQKQEVQATGSDKLSNAMNGVDLNKFDLNPKANAFVPSWLKK